jgi:LAO/AO transport system kinase
VGGAVHLFDAFGFDIVLIETVGVGQAEVDVAEAADTTIVVQVPGLGDSIQTIKAGVLEIADILVVNKADRPDARQLVRDLRNMLLLGDHDAHMPPIVPTIATEADGIARLIDEIAAHRVYLQESGTAEDRVRHRLQREVSLIAREQFDRWLIDWVEDRANGHVFDGLVQRADDPGSVADNLLDDFRTPPQRQSV